MKAAPDGVSFQLKIEEDTVKAGFADNAIVEAFTKITVRKKDEEDAKEPKRTQRVSLGVLPAVPFVVEP